MGLKFLPELKTTTSSIIYVCRICINRIAFGDDFNYHYTPVTGVNGGVFDKTINTRFDQSVLLSKLGPHTVADVHCLGCGNHLGWKFVIVSEEDPAVEEGMLLLPLGKLLMLEGNETVATQEMKQPS